MKLPLISILLLSSSIIHAETFDNFDDKYKELKETAIVQIGNVEKINPPPDIRFTNDVLKIVDKCVQLTSGYWTYGSKAGILAADKYLNYKLATFESGLSSLKVTIYQVNLVDCSFKQPSASDSYEKLMSDLKRTQEQQKRIEALQKQRNELILQQQKLNQAPPW